MAGAALAEITQDHERWQAAGDEQQWSDSFYFGGGDGQRGVASAGARTRE